MSFTPFIVEDSRINDITPKLDYAVYRGASSNNFQSYTSNSASGSSISFNIQPPSESTIISREVMIETIIKFQIEITNVPSGNKAFSYGFNDSFQAFPMNSLISSANVTINNTNISSNLQDTKDLILKCIPPKALGKYQSTCPTMVDSFYKYYGDGGNNSELNGFVQSSYDKYLQPRGCHPLRSYAVQHFVGGILIDDSIVSTSLTDRWVISLETKTTEPLLISPFIFGPPNVGSQMGLYGINHIEIILNIDATLKRFWSSKNSNYQYTLRLDQQNPFTSNILLNYLTPQPDNQIEAKNVVPYLLYPRYITPISNTSSIAPGQSTIISCQNIQLSKIPDLLLVVARKAISNQNCFDSASFLPIKNVSINFNNQSALLATATQQDLYKISLHNGIQQTYYEWSGYASTFDFLSTNGAPNTVPTVGSVLALNPALDLSLDPTLANGSAGSFNLQINLGVENNGTDSITPEVCIVAVTSGLLTTLAGNSSLNSGFLTAETVLEASKAPKWSRVFMERKIGGGIFSTIGRHLKGISSDTKKTKEEPPTVRKKLVSYIK